MRYAASTQKAEDLAEGNGKPRRICAGCGVRLKPSHGDGLYCCQRCKTTHLALKPKK
jgi:NADH pyrophosphatase NudC (nudix superfamily)